MSKMHHSHISWQHGHVTKQDRQKLNGHPSYLLWFTGLSGSGKSTLTIQLEKRLINQNMHVFILDGDNIRHGLNKNLGFSPEDRTENIRRIAEVSKLMVSAGVVTLSAFISPYRAQRQMVKDIMDDGDCIEIYVQANLRTCEKRDSKGLYEKARKGEIRNFTGIDAPYEEPESPDLIVNTEKYTIKQSVDRIYQYLLNKNLVKK
ncbi:adenylyl-sulfate kinase [Longirhabdus pacifica]|uniref:adenylyl-sulfate kinase n=1 Tax=Longirhabdus pacifica TaxID=2305227 RepID=UPI0010088CAA|nr:adenylyl-sulfate kinase [Longirhabdus pacifica]